MTNLVPIERIESKIYLIRGQRVMLNFDLAALYGVETRALNQAVLRNIDRFPQDFMFQLTWEELKSLRSQYVILKNAVGESGKRGRHIKYLPYAFTEQGVAMLSSILRSKRAIHVNIAIMRVFVRFKQILATHKKLAAKLNRLEQKIEKHDVEIQSIFNAIRKLMAIPIKPKSKIGFLADKG